MKYADFKLLLRRWANHHPHIQGAGIVGSYARRQQTPDSDIDVVIFTDQPERFTQEHTWLAEFGPVGRMKVEQWGVVRTVRAFFRDGTEIEFNFCTLEWANIPIDPGTHRVVSDGLVILYDPTAKLTQLREKVRANHEYIPG